LRWGRRRPVAVDRPRIPTQIWWKRCTGRSPGATEALIALYGDRAYRLAMRITGNRSDAEEVVQDAFWTVVRRIETFRGDAAFGSWLYRITANSAYTKLRVRRARHHESSWDEISLMVDEAPRSMHDDWSEHLEDPALQLELRRVLAAALDTLPDNYRAIVVLRDVEGLSPQPISQITGLSVAAVKTRTHRARLRLRKWLSEYFSDRPLSPRRYLQCLRRAGAPLPSNHRDRLTSFTVSRPFTATAVAGPRHEQFKPRNRSSIVCVKPTE
jgi:RNA polymerase sigma-70 factor, ECF subfamily